MTNPSLDFDLARLRSLIPKDHTGKPVNTRMRDLDRILQSYRLGPADLAFFEREIQHAAAAHEETRRKRDEFVLSRAEQISERHGFKPAGVPKPHMG